MHSPLAVLVIGPGPREGGRVLGCGSDAGAM